MSRGRIRDFDVRQNSDADLPRGNANDEGENGRGLREPTSALPEKDHEMILHAASLPFNPVLKLITDI